METLSSRLSSTRALASGLSNAELDRLCGLVKGHTRLLETKSDPNPELKTLQAIAATLGTTVGYLAGGEGDGPTPRAVRNSVNTRRLAYAEERGLPRPIFNDAGELTGHEPVQRDRVDTSAEAG